MLLRRWVIRAILFTCLLLLLAPAALAADPVPYLVRDINGNGAPSGIENLTVVGDKLFFWANDGSDWNGCLWVKDADGTLSQLASAKCLGTGDRRTIWDCQGVALFSGEIVGQGDGLCRSDGTPEGTWLIRDWDAAEYGPKPLDGHVIGSSVFFFVDDGVHGHELWITDGTPEGTRLVRDINPNGDCRWPDYWYPAGHDADLDGIFYFRASDGSGDSVWRSDGTMEGTTKLREDIGGNGAQNLSITACNGQIFFVEAAGDLWVSDGTTSGTRILEGSGKVRDAPVAANGWLYYGYRDESDDWFLYRTDGSACQEIAPVSPWISNLTWSGDLVFFRASSDEHGQELWRSDGTAQGTYMARDIRPGPDDAGIPWLGLTAWNGKVWFSADDGEHGRELWVSDGTEAGTNLVRDLWPGGYPGVPTFDYDMEGMDRLYFTGNNGSYGVELWSTDGTHEGTVMGTDINPQGGASDALRYSAATLDDVLIFTASDDAAGQELWRSDGTITGTWRVQDIRPGDIGSDPTEIVAWQGMAYFAADDWTHYRELWRSDGTEAGTTLVADVDPEYYGDRKYLTPVGETLFFVAQADEKGHELWKLDAATQLATQVKDIRPGEMGSSPQDLVPVGERLFFTADDGDHGRELWVSDGTEDGTHMVRDIMGGSDGSEIYYNVAACNGVLYFSANDGVYGNELWRSDGTEAGTTMLADIYPDAIGSWPSSFMTYQGNLYFSAYAPDHGRELWRTDGTAQGTEMVVSRPGSDALSPMELLAHNESLYFVALYDDHFWLYRTDGTQAGTVNLGSVYDRSTDPNPAPSDGATLTGWIATSITLHPAGDYLILNGNDGQHGWEPWISDGTPEGTHMLADLAVGPASSVEETYLPGHTAGDTFFFSADDGVHGNELWAVSLAAAPDVYVEISTFTEACGQPGTEVRYEITVGNAGGEVATSATLTATWPISLTGALVSTSGYTFEEMAVGATQRAWRIAEMAPDSYSMVTVRGTVAGDVSRGDRLVFDAETAAPLDGDPSNNAAQSVLVVNAPVSLPMIWAP